ncbi:hypothetical protein [Butyricimonas virosa]|uniref:hypothetical protein n=1 Tax=Butyricimonas virosa TaxID=544645 RepID=UPI002664EC31|nr:hypothetical protein [Butyricimonas virosa]
MTEVLQASLSCVHGLRLQVFFRRHLSFKRSCLPLPRLAKARQDGLRTGKT